MFKFFARKKSDPYPASDQQHHGDGGESLTGGLNVDNWDVVAVQVPPGPLGIVLDGNSLSAAVVDEFSPLPDGRKGAIEAHGGVHRGSVLMSVNEFDLLADKMTLMEAGHVLRETSHLDRIMRFRVPPQPEVDHTGLSLEKQSLLSRMISSSSSSVDLLQSAEPVVVLRKPSLTDANLLTVTVKGLKLEPPAAAKQFVGGGKFVAVDVPPGPLGLNLDGAVRDHGVVLGFVPLPDGSKGTLETHGGVKLGSVLIEINDENVSKLPLDELRAKLSALSGSPRRLVFRLPTSSSSAASKRQSQVAAELKHSKARNVSMVKMHVEEDLEKRRKLELALVLKFDKSKIKRSECWFMVDAQWMARWVAFVGQGGTLPGAITNENLLLPEWRDRLNGEIPGEPDTPRPGLERSTDFRCVNPMVWSILSELHSAGDAPLIAR